MPAIRSARALLSSLVLAAVCGCNHLAVTPTPAPPAAAKATAVPVEEADIASLQAKLQAGTLTAHALTQAYLDRIASIASGR